MDKLRQYLKYHVKAKGIAFIEYSDPTIDVNPETPHAIWYNVESGEFFICTDNTPNKNIWRGDKGTIIQPSTLHVVDIFEDGSCKALWTLDQTLNDLGGLYNGKWWNNKIGKFVAAKFNYGVQSYRNCQILLPTPFDKGTTLATVSFWFYWNGRNSVMPIGWFRYDLYIYRNYLGFNTGNGDVYGIPFSNYRRKWVHIVAEFHKGEYGKIWLNGKPMTLQQARGSIYVNNAVLDRTLRIFGWGANTSYRNAGIVDHIRIFDRALTDSEVQLLYSEH